MPLDPFFLIASLIPQVKDDEELLDQLALLGPAPGEDFQPQQQLPPPPTGQAPGGIPAAAAPAVAGGAPSAFGPVARGAPSQGLPGIQVPPVAAPPGIPEAILQAIQNLPIGGPGRAQR